MKAGEKRKIHDYNPCCQRGFCMKKTYHGMFFTFGGILNCRSHYINKCYSTRINCFLRSSQKDIGDHRWSCSVFFVYIGPTFRKSMTQFRNILSNYNVPNTEKFDGESSLDSHLLQESNVSRNILHIWSVAAIISTCYSDLAQKLLVSSSACCTFTLETHTWCISRI